MMPLRCKLFGHEYRDATGWRPPHFRIPSVEGPMPPDDRRYTCRRCGSVRDRAARR
jgi:hypothetical protein